MPESIILEADEVRDLVATGHPYRVVDVRGRAAYRKAEERVAGDLRAHGVGMILLVAGMPDDTLYLLYCT